MNSRSEVNEVEDSWRWRNRSVPGYLVTLKFSSPPPIVVAQALR